MVNFSYVETEDRYPRNNGNNNNMNLSSSEFRTISLGIHSELANLRAALDTSDRRVQLQMPCQKETALDIARQITNLTPEPLFITVGYNGCDMCVSICVLD